MPRFRCLACGQVLEAPTRDELMKLIEEHAKTHGLTLNPVIEAIVKRMIED